MARKPALGLVPLRRRVGQGSGHERIGCSVIVEHGPSPPADVREPLAGGRAISLQDKCTLQVPDGLAFSEFRGYENWPVIAISENGSLIAVILGNPVMIDAYKEGVPGNGKPFPDGAC